jgi:hypothetical protein
MLFAAVFGVPGVRPMGVRLAMVSPWGLLNIVEPGTMELARRKAKYEKASTSQVSATSDGCSL